MYLKTIFKPPRALGAWQRKFVPRTIQVETVVLLERDKGFEVFGLICSVFYVSLDICSEETFCLGGRVFTKGTYFRLW